MYRRALLTLTVIVGLGSFAFETQAQLDLEQARYGATLGLMPGGGGRHAVFFDDDRNRSRFRDETFFALAGYAVFPLQDAVWGGARLVLVPTTSHDVQGGGDFDLGTQLETRGRLDYVIPLADQADLHLVGEPALLFLFPRDDLEDAIDAFDARTGPRIGFGLGGSLGITYQATETLRLRGDLMLDMYTMRILNEEVDSLDENGQEIVVDYIHRIGGNRFWLLFGMEF